ncbi:uncharacterized protein B4U80_07611, partial [Leptotrombidium deliense]
MGFNNTPIDFRPRPFWLHRFMNDYKTFGIGHLMGNESAFCFNKCGTNIEQFLQHLYQFVTKMRNMKQPLKTYLSNSITIIMGDHGSRFGAFAETPMGQIEARLPLFSIRIPEEIHSKHPHLRNVLDKNRQSLTSWFDIYQLLRDVAHGNFDFTDEIKLGPLNLTRQLEPPARTCNDAGIPTL